MIKLEQQLTVLMPFMLYVLHVCTAKQKHEANSVSTPQRASAFAWGAALLTS